MKSQKFKTSFNRSNNGQYWEKKELMDIYNKIRYFIVLQENGGEDEDVFKLSSLQWMKSSISWLRQ